MALSETEELPEGLSGFATIGDAGYGINLRHAPVHLSAFEPIDDLGHQLRTNDGLGHEVIRAGSKQLVDRVLVAIIRHEEDGKSAPARVVAHHPTELDAAKARHIDVNHDEV